MRDADIKAKQEMDELFAGQPSFRDAKGILHFPEKTLLEGRHACVRCNGCGKFWGAGWNSFRVGIEEYAKAHEALRTI